MRLASITDDPPAPAEIEIVDTSPGHIQELQQTMRDDDRAENEVYGWSGAKGLWRSYKRGIMNRTMLIDGRVACCWGIGGEYMGDIGHPWLLTSDEIDKISPLKFTRLYQIEVNKMLKLFPRLENWCDSRYASALRLLSIIGFTIDEPEPFGGGLFCRFSLEAQ